MPDFQPILEAVLILLLGATLFHAVRLERALGRLKRDRATLGALVAEFNDSTRQAESGIERLRQAADGAGRQIARQSEMAGALKGDLAFLVERGERLADRLDRLVRSGRGVETGLPATPVHRADSASPLHRADSAPPLHRADSASPLHRADSASPLHRADSASPLHRAESTKLPADGERRTLRSATAEGVEFEDEMLDTAEPQTTASRVRSQAERDLLRALKMVR